MMTDFPIHRLQVIPPGHRGPAFVLALLLGSGASLMAQALTWENSAGFRSARLEVPSTGQPGFRLLPGSQTGIRWTNQMSGARMMERQNLMNGSGVAAGDYDGDGLCDLYFCSTAGSNALFRNLGNWRFQEVTHEAGVGCGGQASTGAVFADINGDGRLDLLVTSFTGPDACFLNLGASRFTNVTASAGLTSKGGTTSMALGDLDGDGDLDLYVCHFAVEAILRDGANFSVQMVDGRPTVGGRYARRLRIIDGMLVELGDPDVVYRNGGDGRFTPLNWGEFFQDEEGKPVLPPPDLGLAVQIRDLNGDGHPDIYVCNDFQTPDRIWMNDGRGRFRALNRLAMRNMSFAAMGVDFADVDRDGRLDGFVVEMLSRNRERHLRQSSPMPPVPRVPGVGETREEVARNTLFWNRGDGTYAEIAWFSGLAASDWSWTPAFIDVDLDGYEDVLVTNGHLRDVNDRDVNERRRKRTMQGSREDRSVLLEYPRLATPNAAFRNGGDLTFADMSQAWGFDSIEVSQGMALADLDNDGDQDVVVNAAQVSPLLYRNNAPAPRVAVRLRGAEANTQGIGAWVELAGGAVPVQQQEILCGGRYLSGDDPMRVFAAGLAPGELTLRVNWRSGRRSVIRGVQTNRVYEVHEQAAEAGPAGRPPENPAPRQEPLFEDVSEMLDHRHTEDAWDDFALRPWLPRKLSQPGPGVAWFDFDADGWEDLFVGGGRGGRLAAFRNAGGGRLVPAGPPLDPPFGEDATAVVAWVGTGGTRSLLVGLTARDTGLDEKRGLLQFECTNGIGTGGTPGLGVPPGVGAMLVADVEGDGDLDLFIGGRLVPGRYPEPADSRLFRNEQGRLVEDQAAAAAWRGLGLVNAACFSDLDADGLPELVLACEWGALRVFQNLRGGFQDATDRWGLGASLGLWTSVQSGDFDGDGRMDLVAGNWGLNTHHRRFAKGPWYLYAGDFNGDGQVQTLEAALDTISAQVVPIRGLEQVSAALPWVRGQFETHEAYARAGVKEVLGDRLARARELRATTLASTLFLNRGDHFEAHPLPREAQWTTAWGLVVGDFNGDCREDLFVGQNCFAVRTEDDREAAGRGLLLMGDGQGGFKPLAGTESGIAVYGEQRGAATADYDGDGRPDLVVTQNAGLTRLFRNRGGVGGLRVRLEGPPSNPAGIGCAIRLVLGSRLGPAREVHGGGGYLSQDGAVSVLGAGEVPTQIQVRWPGGRSTLTRVPPGAKEVRVPAPE